MKHFDICSMDEVRKVSKQQIVTIKVSTGSIFLEQDSVYKGQMKAIKDECTTTLDD